MLQALKRDQPRSSRSTLLGQTGDKDIYPARETDTTAELDNRGIISLQQQVMKNQDTELEHLEHSVVRTKHIALQINEETQLHNHLLEELETDLDSTSNRLALAQKKLKMVMRKASGCKTQLLVFLLIVILMLVIILGFKIAVHIY